MQSGSLNKGGTIRSLDCYAMVRLSSLKPVLQPSSVIIFRTDMTRTTGNDPPIMMRPGKHDDRNEFSKECFGLPTSTTISHRS